jgi:hypothetical protein
MLICERYGDIMHIWILAVVIIIAGTLFSAVVRNPAPVKYSEENDKDSEEL